MRISELITELEAIKTEHGDLEVTKYGSAGDAQSIRVARVVHIKEKTKREFYRKYATRDADIKKEKVVRIDVY